MSLTVYLVCLAVGGLVIGALFGTLLPRIAEGRLWPVASGLVFSVIGGYLMADFFEAEYSVGLPVVLALSPFWLWWASRSSGGDDGGGYFGSWSGGDSGSGDCGGGDGGGGGCD